MTLPKFTAGQVGKLEFHHLNEAFERIERLDGNPALVAASGPILGRVILVRITGQSGSGNAIKGSFQEVALSTVGSNSYVAVSGGVTSAVSGDTYGAPIVFPCSAIGTIVPVLGHIAHDGKLYFRECAGVSSAAGVRAGRITASTQITSNTRWLYTLTDVRVNTIAAGTYTATGVGSFQALNGCEEAVDSVANRNIGVGTIHVVGSTATRQPIKNDTIVVCTETLGGFVFSVPNGYAFTCT